MQFKEVDGVTYFEGDWRKKSRTKDYLILFVVGVAIGLLIQITLG